MNITIDPKIFNKAYLPYITDYAKRYECYYGGAGSGKSVFISQKILIKALNYKRKVLIMRKVGTSLKDSVWQLMIDTLQQFQLYDKCKVNKCEMKIELPNGSIFLFKALDDEEKIKSITGITDVWMEECTEFTLDDFTQLDLRLRAKVPCLQIFLSLNPVSKSNWVYLYFFESGIVPDNTMILKTTYKDNRFLPQSYIDALLQMKEKNPIKYKIYAEGEFCTLDKLIYPNYKVEEFDYREKLRSEDTTAVWGCDFGYINDESAIISVVVDKTAKKLYIYDEMYQKGMLNNEIAGWIISHGYSKEVIIADCAEQKSIEEIRRYGVPRIKKCWKGKGSIMQGIQYIQQYEIIVHPKCQNTITELQNYAYKKNKQTNEYINEPIDKFNHLMDALRYAIQSVSSKGTIKTFKKSFLGL